MEQEPNPHECDLFVDQYKQTLCISKVLKANIIRFFVKTK